MGRYQVVYTKLALKDAHRLVSAGLADTARQIAEIVSTNPFQAKPPYEKLVGDLTGWYSRRINIHHRFLYEVLENRALQKESEGNVYDDIVRVARMWTHYE